MTAAQAIGLTIGETVARRLALSGEFEPSYLHLHGTEQPGA